MILGRTSEQKYLNQYYAKEGSQILVVYGQKYIGKTALTKEFIKDKQAHYYLSRACSEREQVCQWGKQLSGEKNFSATFPAFREIFQRIVQGATGKKVIIIDEFQHVIKTSDLFFRELVSFVHDKSHCEVMVLLCSSSIGWIENSMIARIGSGVYELSGFLKVRGMQFDDMMQYFSNFRVEECVEAYAILGSMPGLWKQFDDRLTIQQNICRHILEPDSLLFQEGERIVTEQLREPGVYNTILAAMAAGHHKLNDLYQHTEFSRAKISVYMKNLMELELVEKVFSYDTEGRENTKKGIYRISHPFVDFYFTYLYPNMSALQTLPVSEFYTRYIQPDFKEYVASYFKQICRQHLDRLSEEGKLPLVVETIGEWVGKDGTLDMIAQDETGKTLIGMCNWQKAAMAYQDYEALRFTAKKARIQADYVYLYTATGFDERLQLEAMRDSHLKLIPLTQLSIAR